MDQTQLSLERKHAISALQVMQKGHYSSGKIKDRLELYAVHRKLIVSSGIIKFFFQIYTVFKDDIEKAIEKVRVEMKSSITGYETQTPSVDHNYYREYREQLESTVGDYFACRNQFTITQLVSIIEIHLVEWVFCEIELQKLMYRKVGRDYTKVRFEDAFSFLNELECSRLCFDNIAFQSLAKKSGLVVVQDSPDDTYLGCETNTGVVFDDFKFDSLKEYNLWEKVDFLLYKKKYDSESSACEQNKLFIENKGEAVITRFTLTEKVNTEKYEKIRRDGLSAITHG